MSAAAHKFIVPLLILNDRVTRHTGGAWTVVRGPNGRRRRKKGYDYETVVPIDTLDSTSCSLADLL